MLTSSANPYFNYYTYNNCAYTTKLNALLSLAQKESIDLAGDKISWHAPAFQKDTKNVYLEPKFSLKEYYLQRAMYIREKYDYVILHYSGGTDSHNILETFMLNNVFIDEIAIHYYPPSIYSENPIYMLCDHLHEVPKAAKPLAEFFISKYSPKTKLTIKTNIRESIIKFWQNLNYNKYKDVFKTMVDVWLTRDPIRMYNIQQYSDEPKRWQHLKETKKVGHVFGLEKPMLFMDDAGIYCTISDNILNGRCDPTKEFDLDELPYHVEYFYIHPSLFDMYLKSSHTLLKNIGKYPTLISNLQGLDEEFVYKFQLNPAIRDMQSTQFIRSGRDYQSICAEILYTPQIKQKFQTVKPGDLLFNQQFTNLAKPIKDIYYETLNLGLIGKSPYNIDYVIYAFIKQDDQAYKNYIDFLKMLGSLFPSYSIYEILNVLRKNYHIRFYLK